MAGGYEFQPPYEQMLAAELRKLQNQIDALRAALAGLGIQIDPNGNLIFDGSRGDLNITNGGSLNVDGTLAVTGDALFEGNLAVPNGSIDNTALANPTAFATTWNDNNSTNLTVAGLVLAPMTLTVPSGFTKAQVVCSATVGNSRTLGAGNAPYYMQAMIATTGSAVIAASCTDGGGMSLTAGWVANLSGLTAGGTITGSAWGAVDTTTGWKAGAANAHAVMYATFLR